MHSIYCKVDTFLSVSGLFLEEDNVQFLNQVAKDIDRVEGASGEKMMRKKRYAVIFMVLFLVATAIYLVYKNSEPIIHVPIPKDEIIVWSDKEVERQVREQAKKPEGDIWLSDLWDICVIELEGEEVYSIKDLSVLLNLNSLSLINTSVTDLSPVAGLKVLFNLRIEGGDSRILDSAGQLKYVHELSLRGLQIDSLDSLKGLKQMGIIWLYDMPVQDIEAVKYMKDLKKFLAHNTLINDISPLKNLKELKWLEIFNSEVSEIPDLSGAKKLRMILLYNNKIEKIVALPKSLQVLEMPYNNLKSDENIKTAKNLHILNLNHNELKTITEISSLENLVELGLSNNNLKEIGPLKSAKGMLRLYLTVSELVNFGFLEGMEQLDILDLSGTDLSKLNMPIPNIESLDRIIARDCKLTNLELFTRVEHLKRLDVRANNVQDLSAVSQLKELSHLDISKNIGLGELVFPANDNIMMVVAEECELKSLDVFLPVSGLISLDVSGNKIESVEAIRDMKKLKEIDINDNVIQPKDVLTKFVIDLKEWGW